MKQADNPISGNIFRTVDLMVLREKIVKLWPGTVLPESVDLGVCSESPNFAIPAAIQNNWVMELSPQPLLIPALYLQGSGAEYSLPKELWERLGTGIYWIRFSADYGKTIQCYHWRVE